MHRKELLALKTFPAYFTQDPNQTQSQHLERNTGGYWVSFQAMSRVGWFGWDTSSRRLSAVCPLLHHTAVPTLCAFKRTVGL